ncbi:MAG: hypothetical protein AB7D36_02720 [Oscillospiraceae bacterium]
MIDPIKKFRRNDILDINLRLEPENRLCPNFDCTSITYQKVAPRDVMGVRVVDNFCEEHIM